jgi:hypothetical protein
VEPETFPSVVRRPDLEKQIYSLPYSQALVIGLRASLRALPLFDLEITNEPEFASELLAVLRVVSSCWIAATFPDQTHHRIQSQAALANGIGAQHPLARAVIEANTYSSVEAQLRSIATIVVGAIEDLRIYATSLDGHAAGVIAGMSVSDDINDLNGTSAVAIAQLALWPGGTPPEWTTLRWDNLKRKLISLGVGWEVWVNWYEDRLAGNTRSQEHEFVYTNVPDDMWADGPARVNTWISRTIERSHSSKSVENPPTIPAQKAAAIEPIWRNGRLTLKNTAAKADLKGGAFAAALRGLREELQTFADDITNEVNIDKRFVAIVRRLVDQIPSKPPLQAEIFRLGHAETIFSGYANTVNTEWPPALAAQYHALSLHFDRILRQVPLWREFKRNAANDVFSQSQVQEAALLATELATTLRFEEANTLIDPAIPEAVEGLAQTLKAALTANSENPEAAVKAGLELLAYDVVESVNNILKSIFEVAIWTGIPTTLKKAGAKFNTEAQKSIITEAGRIGKHVGPTITKWAKRTAYATIATTGHHYYGKPLLLWLAANYSDAFSWLVPIVKWF